MYFCFWISLMLDTESRLGLVSLMIPIPDSANLLGIVSYSHQFLLMHCCSAGSGPWVNLLNLMQQAKLQAWFWSITNKHEVTQEINWPFFFKLTCKQICATIWQKLEQRRVHKMTPVTDSAFGCVNVCTGQWQIPTNLLGSKSRPAHWVKHAWFIVSEENRLQTSRHWLFWSGVCFGDCSCNLWARSSAALHMGLCGLQDWSLLHVLCDCKWCYQALLTELNPCQLLSVS